MWYVITAVLALAIGFQFGFYLNRIIDLLKYIKDNSKDDIQGIVTPLSPDESDVLKTRNQPYGIVTPKTPYEIERDEELRRQSQL